MDAVDEYLSALQALPVRRKKRSVARCVRREAVERSDPPDFLYASKRAGRYNPAGIECVYWSEKETTAQLEYRRYTKILSAYETFFCNIDLAFVDLEDASVLAALDLRSADLHRRWRTSSLPVKTQILGLAVSRQNRFAAIRFPSDAGRAAGQDGFNYVIFRDSLRGTSSSIEVVTDPSLKAQRWP